MSHTLTHFIVHSFSDCMPEHIYYTCKCVNVQQNTNWANKLFQRIYKKTENIMYGGYYIIQMAFREFRWIFST